MEDKTNLHPGCLDESFSSELSEKCFACSIPLGGVIAEPVKVRLIHGITSPYDEGILYFPEIPFSIELYNHLWRAMRARRMEPDSEEFKEICLTLWNLAQSAGSSIDEVVFWFIDSIQCQQPVQEKEIFQIHLSTLDFSYKFDDFERAENLALREESMYGINIARRQHNHHHSHLWRTHVPAAKPKSSRKILRQKKMKK